ncbi:hypothetical protein [Oscillibacter sp.]|uniref:hypothetical protein n=1 Tax=Oscillibacter sp. TaxID=1945593 RepID=UPI00289B681C|nr:hypothetical protein [Oscillibacter sp.]
MVIEVFYKNGNARKFCKAVSIAVMGGDWNDKLYIQTRINGHRRESFIPLTEIARYYIHEPC